MDATCRECHEQIGVDYFECCGAYMHGECHEYAHEELDEDRFDDFEPEGDRA